MSPVRGEAPATGDGSPHRALSVTGSPPVARQAEVGPRRTAIPSATRAAATRWARSGSSGQPVAVGTSAAAHRCPAEGVDQASPALAVGAGERRLDAAGAGRPLGRVGRGPSRRRPRAPRTQRAVGARLGPLAADGGAHVEEGLVPRPPLAVGDEGVGQGLGLGGAEAAAGEGPGQHPGGVDLHDPHVVAEGEGEHGPGGVGADAREGRRRAARSRGSRPPWCSTTATAARCRFTARRL